MRSSLVWMSLLFFVCGIELHAFADAPRRPRRTENAAATPTPRATARAQARSTERHAASTKKKKKRAVPQPCYARAVELLRSHNGRNETETLSLTMCNGRPNLEALDRLSILARPPEVRRPTRAEVREYKQRVEAQASRAARRQARTGSRRESRRADPAFVSTDVRRLDPRLLARLQAVATRWPNRRIEIISGYRARERSTSRHNQGRALDVSVSGVGRERVVAFARTLDETGVGYYPNSPFTHIDVRDAKAYWVDRSGPGEYADYGVWPPPEEEVERRRVQAIAIVSDLARDYEAPADLD